MICDLTGMNFSNASLLDEATACAEAMGFCIKVSKLKKNNNFFISNDVFPQNLAVMETRAESLGINIIVGDPFTYDFAKNPVCGVLFQYPAINGEIKVYKELVESLKEKNILSVFSADLLALTILTPPGDFGADVVVGTTQRFGVPLGYGGPHAGYFAVADTSFARKIPGRVVGVTVDSHGGKAYRLTLQTREQHIKREKATSNICTAQALPANISGFYAVYHGPEGLKRIGKRVHLLTATLATGLKDLGHTIVHDKFFDTLAIRHKSLSSDEILKIALETKQMNFRKVDRETVCISLDETTILEDVVDIWKVFNYGEEDPKFFDDILEITENVENIIETDERLHRTSPYLTNAGML